MTMRNYFRRSRKATQINLCRKILTNTVLFSAFAFSSTSHAADLLFEFTQNAKPVAGAGIQAGQVSFPSISGDDLNIGDVFDVAMPSGAVVEATVVMNTGAAPIQGYGKEFVSASTDSKLLRLADQAGSIKLHLVDNAIGGMTLSDFDNEKMYRASLDANGVGGLAEIDRNSILCSTMPVAADEEADAQIIAKAPAGLTLDDVQNLESRPGATNTVFIDNWGGVLSGTVWNEEFNEGADINYTPYSGDNDTTAFSDDDIRLIWLAWAEMAEDYADFDVNITTSSSVYGLAPPTSRSRIVSTTTCAWFFNCGAGGVAYVGIFDSPTIPEGFRTGWTFNRSAGSVGMTHSHEAGHQMGLNHDGTSTSEYFTGNAVGGPIMGAPFNKNYVQWSKGEYSDANNNEDDLSILTTVLGQRPDDVGDSKASPNTLEATDGTNYMITQQGIAEDVDVFSFTLSSPQMVSIDVLPTLAFGAEATAANAALNVTLEDSAGTVRDSISSSDASPLLPTTNVFSSELMLEADTYYLTVDAVSPDLDWATGFGEYGNGGEYRLIVDMEDDPGVDLPSITTPAPGSVLAGYTDTFNWVSNGTVVDEYWVYVGSTPGGYDYGTSGSLDATTLQYSPTGLPVDGSTVYVTLFWHLGELEDNGDKIWGEAAYTYTAATANGVAFTSPLSGATLAGVSETFEWAENDSGAQEYWLYLGSAPGSRDYYNSGLISELATTVTYMAIDADDTVTYLPTDGSTVYARLWHRATSSDRWVYIDDSFVAASSGGPTITSPVPGSALSGSPVTFSWEAGEANVTEWWLYAGTAPGLFDIYNSSNSLATPSSLSTSVPMPADGSTVHITLWFKINGGWKSEQYTYESNADS